MPFEKTSLWFAREPDVQRFPRLAEPLTADVVVIGGGIAGVSAAYFLARAGKRVVLLEAHHLGSGETGFTTAFLTSAVDQALSRLRAQLGDDHLRRVWQAGEETISLVETLVAEEALACGFHRLDALAMGVGPDTAAHLTREAEALRQVGGKPTLLGADEARRLTGVSAQDALQIPRQGAFDVRAFLFGLADRLQRRGGQIFEETRLTGLEIRDRVIANTARAAVTAGAVVLATGLFPRPYQEINQHFRQMVTYVIALATGETGWQLPDFLYWDVGEPFHYLRFLNGALLVGGEDRPRGEASAAGEAPWTALETFARSFVPGPGDWAVTHAWRGQILETADALPVVGVPPGGDPRVFLASGFGGNGMTFGTRAGKTISDLVTGALDPSENPFRFNRKSLDR